MAVVVRVLSDELFSADLGGMFVSVLSLDLQADEDRRRRGRADSIGDSPVH